MHLSVMLACGSQDQSPPPLGPLGYAGRIDRPQTAIERGEFQRGIEACKRPMQAAVDGRQFQAVEQLGASSAISLT